MKKPLIESSDLICWNPAYQVEIIEKEGVFLFSNKQSVWLKGSEYQLIAPLIGQNIYSADQMVDRLRNDIDPAIIYYLLNCLDKKKFIQKKEHLFPPEFAAYCGNYALTQEEVVDRLSRKTVYLANLASVELDRFIGLLQSLHVQITDQPHNGSLLVAVVHDYLQKEIAPIEEMANRLHIPWLLVKPFGIELWFGPLFTSLHLGCWKCLTAWLKGNRVAEMYLSQKKGSDLLWKNLSCLPTTLQCAYSLVATEIFKFLILGNNEQLENKILTFDTIDSKFQQHSFHCCHSGNEEDQQLATTEWPKLLRSRKKGVNGEGFRASPVEETLKKMEKFVSPITGVVEKLEAPDSYQSHEIHVYQGGINQGSPSGKGFGNKCYRSLSGGKGTNALEAKVSCLCEAIERFSGIFNGGETRTTATYSQLKEQAIHPQQVLCFSSTQYQEAKERNTTAHSFNKIFDPFPEECAMEWSPFWSLNEKKYKYFPTCCSFFRYPDSKRVWNAVADSNGCAAGNCLEEAILQGFFELVERDCVAIWWYNRLNRPEVNLESFQLSYIEKMRRAYSQFDREFWVLDLTHDLSIPCMCAVSKRTRETQEKIIMGFGAHLDPHIALIRAISEMNQMLFVAQEYNETHTSNPDHKIELEWLLTATINNQPYLQGNGMKGFSDYTVWESDDLLKDIVYCQEIVENLGLELLVLNQTRPEIGLPVVRVMVPGLRHFWQRLGPGRLYDVPVKMGWLNAPLREEQLNPIGMFL